jgi:hypothetical protein
LPCKGLCETHRNNFAWIKSRGGAPRGSTENASGSLSIATIFIAKVPKTMSRVF